MSINWTLSGPALAEDHSETAGPRSGFLDLDATETPSTSWVRASVSSARVGPLFSNWAGTACDGWLEPWRAAMATALVGLRCRGVSTETATITAIFGLELAIRPSLPTWRKVRPALVGGVLLNQQLPVSTHDNKFILFLKFNDKYLSGSLSDTKSASLLNKGWRNVELWQRFVDVFDSSLSIGIVSRPKEEKSNSMQYEVSYFETLLPPFAAIRPPSNGALAAKIVGGSAMWWIGERVGIGAGLRYVRISADAIRYYFPFPVAHLFVQF